LTALAAVAAAVAASRRKENRALLPLLAYVLFVALYHGLTLVKSIRYFYPAYPGLAAMSGLLLARLAEEPLRRRLARAVPAVVLAGSFLGALAFTAIYRRPHPRIEASRWIFAHVPPPARFANESWDDGQPIPLPGADVAGYAGPVLELFDPDSTQKVDKVVGVLDKADWIAVTSNRVYGNVTRIPSVFPMTTAYYRALFSGALGFERAADLNSYPSLGPVSFPDDRAEEQFTVYDHPRVLLFRKTRDYSSLRARRILTAAMPTPPPTMWDWEKAPRARRKVGPPVMPDRRSSHAPAPATSDSLIGSVPAALLWYLALTALGAAAFPLCWFLFSRFADRGFGLARLVGVAVATYVLTLSVSKGGVPNGRGAAFLSAAILAAAGAVAYLRRRNEIARFLSTHRRSLWQSEAVFAAGFLLFTALRAANPEITWGEKPMDFSILNILVRARTLPVSDPWFAGAPLGYYTFGQEMVALVTLLTGISTRYTFNLAFGLLGGVLLQSAFSLARNWGGRLASGIAGAWLVALAGNLAGLREWLAVRRPQRLPLDWHYFWATSRVIKDTINEYPLWSLLFADLHAHVLSMPLLLLFLAAALQFVRAHADPAALPRTRLLSAGALGFFAGIETLTNAWDAPLVGGLLVVAAAVAAASGQSAFLVRGARAVLGFSAASAAALAVAAPLWPPGGGHLAWGKNLEKGAAGVDVTTVFGLFFVLLISWWFCAAADRAGVGGVKRTTLVFGGTVLLISIAFRSADVFSALAVLFFAAAVIGLAREGDERLAAALAGTAFFLVLFAQRLYIFDRMNTFFKLYLEAWLLFAVSAAVLVFRPADRRGAFGRWPLLLRGLLAVPVLLSLFTSVTVARGALTSSRPTYRAGVKGPTLDGLRYFEKTDPGEYRAVMWLRRTIAGTPVVLEAQGPSYQEFGRVSMMTGLPTVLGWEYHVQQRGNPQEEIARRRAAVEAIYSNPRADAVEPLLRRYHVGYVYVGPVERKTYPRPGLAKFDASPSLFRLVYENPEVRIYRVVGGDAEDVLEPEREELPAPESGAATEVSEPEQPPIISEIPARGKPPYSGLKEPRGAAVDDRSRLWVADFGNSRLRLFDAGGGYLGGWGGRGDSTYNLKEPCGVATRGENLYVADTWNGRVLAFTTQGAWKATARELYGPRGVAAASDGSVWVTDTGNHRVIRYDADLGQPRSFGKKGGGELEFDAPVGIAAADSGSIYVCDTGNRRLQVLDREGRLLRVIAIPGWSAPGEPHVEVDAAETVFVSDPTGGVVFELDRSGAVRRRFDSGEDGRAFSIPTGLALDRKNRILYVVNSGSSSISRVKLEGKGD
jgi:YYY domain-containing protein